MMIDAITLYIWNTIHLDSHLVALTLDSRSQECKKAKASALIISAIETCSCDEPCTILFCLFSIQGREPYLYDFVKKNKQTNFMFTCIQTFTD